MSVVTMILKAIASFLVLAGCALYSVFLGRMYDDPNIFFGADISSATVRKNLWYFWLIVFFQLFTIVGLAFRSSLGGKFAAMNVALSLLLIDQTTTLFVGAFQCDTEDNYKLSACKYIGAGLAGAITVAFAQFLSVFIADGAAHEDAQREAKYHGAA